MRWIERGDDVPTESNFEIRRLDCICKTLTSNLVLQHIIIISLIRVVDLHMNLHINVSVWTACVRMVRAESISILAHQSCPSLGRRFDPTCPVEVCQVA